MAIKSKNSDFSRLVDSLISTDVQFMFDPTSLLVSVVK